MFSLNLFRKPVPRLLLGHVVFLLAILLLVPRLARSQVPAWERDDSPHAVDHLDPIEVDATLTLPKLIDLTMAKVSGYCLAYFFGRRSCGHCGTQ